MRQVGIVAVGKLRSAGMRELCDDFYRRCSALFSVEEREIRDRDRLDVAIPVRSWLVVLDERGGQWTSREFASALMGWLQGPHTEVVFVVGGPDGVSQPVRERANVLLSLGKMTLAHQLARVVLAEQLYRAVSIIQGSPYHRD